MREYLISVAEKTCIPMLEKAINNIRENKTYTVIDHISIECSKLEELLRPLWGIAALLKEKDYYITVQGEKTLLTKALRDIILEGSDENSPICFSRFAKNRSEINYANQMITEFAGYCLAINIAPEALWEPYTQEEKTQLGLWIKKWAMLALKNSWRNNHFWFPILAVTGLEKVGIYCEGVEEAMADGFSVLDKMYISDGWYTDGVAYTFDFYLAWSHHVYPLLWTFLSVGTRFFDKNRAEEYKRRTPLFFDYFAHIFDSDGSTCAFGRSLAYRFAQSAYFAVAALADCRIDYGMARRILIKNVSYFMDNSVLNDDNTFPPGYLYNSPAVVENYTSSGGAYWCAKTLLVLMLPCDHEFWQAEEHKMPIEQGDFLINSPIEKVNMVIEGNKNSGITLFKNIQSYYSETGWRARYNDMAGYYNKFVYNSRAGFAISSADTLAADNVISLEFPDSTIASRRFGFTDLGINDGVLVSQHTPFYNDKNSVITSYVLPLKDGFHLRAHKIVLDNEYRVIEGGFSVGSYDDGAIEEKNEAFVAYRYKNRYSALYTVSETPFKYEIRYNMPGLHILAPQSAYPAYVTDILAKGTYYFASVFYFTTGEISAEKPEITINGNEVYVKYKDVYKKIILE